ncbi:NAD(P)/FAD-dependent oxidoreductase [Bacillus tianshenii]|nr:NAD(P)/FAD-dependent oxidoreductase [Bacillus tianshenii]
MSVVHNQIEHFDVVIVGGGPGGLNAALILGRSLRKVALVDDNHPRHAVTYESHGFLTRDGVKPAELRKIAHEQMEKYETVHRYTDVVTDIKQHGKQFITITKSGEKYSSRKVIFATGMRDELPEINGLHEIYGHSAFLCPYCDGWEHKGKALGIIGNGDKIYRYSKEIHHWGKDLILFTNGDARLEREHLNDIKRHGITVIEDKIQRIDSANGQLSELVLESGQRIKRECLFLGDMLQKQASTIPRHLGIETNSNGSYKTEKHGRTNIEGFFIIGDARNVFSGVVKAACEGYEVAEIANNQLIEEDWHNQSQG